MAENSSVQRCLGHVVREGRVEQECAAARGELVASKAEDGEFQRRMIDGTKACAKGAAHGAKAGASYVESNY